MFDELESFKSDLGLDSFGLSFNTLEQVFLKYVLHVKIKF